MIVVLEIPGNLS